jgi:hypothetical protein
MTELAQRAVACRHWRWMPGMREARTGERYEDGDGPWIVNKWPDLTDPATVGCLLALVREAWPGTFVMPYDKEPGWWVAIMPAGPWPDPGPTEPEALVAALEAAP